MRKHEWLFLLCFISHCGEQTINVLEEMRMKIIGRRIVSVAVIIMVCITMFAVTPVDKVMSVDYEIVEPAIKAVRPSSDKRMGMGKKSLASIKEAAITLLAVDAKKTQPVTKAAVVIEETEEKPEEKFIPETIRKVNTLDYYTISSTGLTEEAYSSSEITERVKGYAKFEGNPGMPAEEYRAAMSAEWEDCTAYGGALEELTLDISESYTYEDLVEIMTRLSACEGVYLYKIGKTTEGRDMYAIEVDMPSDIEKKTVVLTGTVHAREIAGSIFVLKELVDLIQDDSEEARQILSGIRFAAVACVNPDGRDGVAFDTKNYTYSDGQLWKATSNGTDLNRNFPGLSWGQIGNSYSKSPYNAKSADCIYYAGDYAGSCPETKALMKFLYHYVVVEKAAVLIDYHQQGRISYAGKPWDKKVHQDACRELSDTMFAMMNPGNSHKYSWVKEESSYGLCGQGSTLTDYACSIAYGAKYSAGYGFCVYTDGKEEYPLCMIPRMDKNAHELIAEPNPDFVTMTFEIGYGRAYLGYTEKTRGYLAKEYEDYRFGRVLYELADYVAENE